MIEKEKDLICQKDHKNQPIVSVLKNGKIPASQRVLCATCIAELSDQFTAISFNQVKNIIQQKHEKVQETLNESVIRTQEQLQQFKIKVDSHKSMIILLFDSLIKNTEEWANNLAQFQKQKCIYSIFDQLEMLNDSMKYQEEKLIHEFHLFNYSYFKKLETTFQVDSLFKNIFSINEAIQSLHIEITLRKGQMQKQIEILEQNENDTPYLAVNCKQHNKEIIYVDLKRDIKKEERLRCINCKIDDKVTVLEFQNLWDQYNNDKQDIIQEYQCEQNKRLEKIKIDLQNLIIDLTKNIKDTYYFLDNNRRQSIDNKIQQDNSLETKLISMIEELSQFKHGLRPKGEMEESQKINEETLTKLNSLIQYMKKELATFQVERELTFTQSLSISSAKDQKKISYSMIDDSIKQQEYCKAISFNHDGSIMAAGCKNDVKIWKFDNGKIEKSLANLEGHTNTVYCLLYSKSKNWIASGGYDNIIRLWKDTGDNQWISSEPGKVHSNSIFCLLMNFNEDQLISGSQDNSIKIWSINFETNSLNFQYSLDKHQGEVYSISLNESETILTSYSSDKQILIWGKRDNSKWEFRDTFKTADGQAQRLCFITDSMIALQSYSYGFVQILQYKKGTLIEKSELKLQLKQINTDGDNLFPTIYNKQRKLLIQKHYKQVHIFRQSEDGKFETECDPIDCKNVNVYGGFTNDGQYLVLFLNNEFKVYRFLYE